VGKGADRSEIFQRHRRMAAAEASRPRSVRVPQRTSSEVIGSACTPWRAADHRRRPVLDRPITKGVGGRRTVAQDHVATPRALERLRVSMTSDEVMPKCSQRADGPDFSANGGW